MHYLLVSEYDYYVQFCDGSWEMRKCPLGRRRAKELAIFVCQGMAGTAATQIA